jgi:hypothetical protein
VAVAIGGTHLADGPTGGPGRLVGLEQQLGLAQLGHVLGEDLHFVALGVVPPGEGHLPHALASAPGRSRCRIGCGPEALLGEIGGVGEAGGLAPHHPDAGAPVAT